MEVKVLQSNKYKFAFKTNAAFIENNPDFSDVVDKDTPDMRDPKE